jgi:Raf kinase inhibitor-like YbhB/YbcL family protein
MTMIFKMKQVRWTISLAVIFLLVGCKSEPSSPAAEGAMNMAISIKSTAFTEGGAIPRLYTCDDQNVSLPLAWSEVPSGTLSLALILDDPDAPSGTFVHWVLFNLPPTLTGLDQGKNGGGTEGINDFRKVAYSGPCPPRGSNHRYFVKLYALDTLLDLKYGSSKAQLESAMRGHILAQGQLMGRYGR